MGVAYGCCLYALDTLLIRARKIYALASQSFARYRIEHHSRRELDSSYRVRQVVAQMRIISSMT